MLAALNEFKTKYLYFSYLYLEIFNNSKIAAPFYFRTFISKMTFSLSGYVGTSSMKSKRKVVFRSLYASQEIHVVLLLKLRVTLALSIRVRIRVDVKMMLPHWNSKDMAQHKSTLKQKGWESFENFTWDFKITSKVIIHQCL